MSKSPATGVLARPGDAIGILGGGQLGRMLALAASDLGLDVHVFTPETDSPAASICFSASSTESPLTSGTATTGGPFTIVTSTFAPAPDAIPSAIRFTRT